MHEESETIQRKDGRWINIYGPGKHRTGQLPASGDYSTVEEASQAAAERSKLHAEPDSLIQGPKLPPDQGRGMDQKWIVPPTPNVEDLDFDKLRKKKAPGSMQNLLQKSMNILSMADPDGVMKRFAEQFNSGPWADANKRMMVAQNMSHSEQLEYATRGVQPAARGAGVPGIPSQPRHIEPTWSRDEIRQRIPKAKPKTHDDPLEGIDPDLRKAIEEEDRRQKGVLHLGRG